MTNLTPKLRGVEVKEGDIVADHKSEHWRIVGIKTGQYAFHTRIYAMRLHDGLLGDFDMSGGCSSSCKHPALREVITERRTIARIASYEAIDGEIKYAEKWDTTLSSGRAPGPNDKPGDRTIDEWILYIRGYAEDLARIGAHANDPKEKLDFVRKVAGLCVKCMDQHGAPLRVVPPEL